LKAERFGDNMAILLLDSENADRDIKTAAITVLTHTPSATHSLSCAAYIEFGDGAKDLDGTGGDFELTITVGGQTIEPNPQVIEFSTAIRTAVWTLAFPVPANSEVIIQVLSPNGADGDVDVTAYLYDMAATTTPVSIADTTGNWNAGATWASGAVPAVGDNIIVRTGVVVTVSANLDLGTFGTQELQGTGTIEIANGQTVAVVPAGWTIELNNDGTITINYGKVLSNVGTITTNKGYVRDNSGTITTNDTSGIVTLNSTGTVGDNGGLIVTNYELATVTDNKSGIITYNHGTVTANEALVVNNDGTVTTNTGMVIHNRNGTVTNDTGDTGTMQSGDSFARLAAPVGLSISADIAAIKAETALIVGDTDELQTLWKIGGTLDVLLKDVPSTAEFNARTVVTAAYFVVTDYTVPPTTAAIKTAIEAAGGHLALILADTATTIPAQITAAELVLVTDLNDVKGTSFVKDTDSLVDLTHTAAGGGNVIHTITVTVGGVAEPDVEVDISSNEAGTIIVASGTTGALGTVVFYLAAGTYYSWAQKAGYNFTNPSTETVA